MTSIETLVQTKVLEIVRLRRPEAKSVSAPQELRADLGLDSLDLAQLGAELESAIGAPIFDDVAIGAILTVGDLTEVCAQNGAGAEAKS